ncbi:hypothetical protein MJO28_009780 [Puccinia striiformis f. sp. tritici]|uniref:Uncharacterized protein n=1 Tax=Puccinia striiformis f. sp. tritici TaxID=168172 RepID=A0ACC0E9J1_9BASI|nr:hypothetical protein MJO28_009780 [Puccinia striiformis f. sp. tritici]
MSTTRSAAVQIRAPLPPASSSSSSSSQQMPSNDQHSDGNNHHQTTTPSTGRKSSPSSPRKYSLPHPIRPATATPIGTGGLTTNAPVFVPGATYNTTTSTTTTSAHQIKLNKSAAEFAPAAGLLNTTTTSEGLFNHSNTSESAPSYSSSSSTSYTGGDHQQQQQQPTGFHNPYASYDNPHHHHHLHHHHQEAYLPIDGFRISAPSISNFQRPLNYHLYAPPLPHSSNQHPNQLSLNQFFMPTSIRETLQKKSAAILQGPTHEVARTPEDLGVYHSLVVLDSPHLTSTGSTVITNTNNVSTTIPGGGIGSTSNNGTTTPRAPYSSRVLKNPSWIYKAFCSLDGKAYCLYRIEGLRLKQGLGEIAISQVERWRKIRHPSIVNVREAFTTRAFGDHSILFVFDYHPLSHTLYDQHISSSSTKKNVHRLFASEDLEHLDHHSSNHHHAQSGNTGHSSTTTGTNGGTRFIKNHQIRNSNGNHHLPRVGGSDERVIWSYIIQIANAIKTVHSANLSVRTIDPTKILLTGTNRVRINGCGILDVTDYSVNQSIEDLQVTDLRDLGRLICSITSSSLCSSPSSTTTTDNNKNSTTTILNKALEYLKQFYSDQLYQVVDYLLSESNDVVSIDGLLTLVWSRGLDEMTKVFNHNDLLEQALARELENGRLVRLMVKLGFINERPEFDHDPNWSETSERYLIKLFRDYVFHQVDGQGKPVTDLSHVLMCLNKLDSSSDEKLTLISRDDQTCAIVTYAEIRRIMDSAFRDLSR